MNVPSVPTPKHISLNVQDWIDYSKKLIENIEAAKIYGRNSEIIQSYIPEISAVFKKQISDRFPEKIFDRNYMKFYDYKVSMDFEYKKDNVKMVYTVENAKNHYSETIITIRIWVNVNERCIMGNLKEIPIPEEVHTQKLLDENMAGKMKRKFNRYIIPIFPNKRFDRNFVYFYQDKNEGKEGKNEEKKKHLYSNDGVNIQYTFINLSQKMTLFIDDMLVYKETRINY